MSIDDLRLQPKLMTEDEMVLAVRMLPFKDAADLIRLYGASERAAGHIEASIEIHNRTACAIEGKPRHA